ncbi:MAG: adenylosuccinate lyase [Candidatus Eisenbacteria bacterium]|nr:adenylosuccinate lyase [Candidatus Eisenbacteria bacterium]
MIARYTRPEMAAVWSDERRYALWLRIEIAVAEAMERRGSIPPGVTEAVRARSRVSAERIAEIERETRHDVIAFLECVEESVGAEARWLHLGLTSSDLLDTALALQIADAAVVVRREGAELAAALRERAVRHKRLVAVGRTHGMYAEPITYGLKFALWSLEIERGMERLERALEEIRRGKLSGAVGTLAHVPPELEEEVLASLGLSPEPIASQVVQRDRHAALLAAIALLGASIEKMATEIRSLQKSDVGEVEEPFREKQKGSSAMPHKRNPILCENLVGLARLLRSYVVPAMENVALWHERDISHSAVERVILPDAFTLLDFALARFTGVVRGLRIREERVRRNLEAAKSGCAAGSVLLALARKGLARRDAYRLVQSLAHRAEEEELDLERLLSEDAEVAARLSEEEIREAFDWNHHVRRVDDLFRRAGIEG